MEWIVENKEWLFSGIGIFIIGFIIRNVAQSRTKTIQKQKSGKNSSNYQSAGDMNIEANNDK